MEQNINQKIMGEYNRSVIGFNGRPMKIKLEAGERYLLMPDFFLNQGHDCSGRAIINMGQINDSRLVDTIESEYKGLVLATSGKSIIIYNGKDVHYCSGWSENWDKCLGASDFVTFYI